MTRSELSRHSLGRVWLHVWDWLVIWCVETLLLIGIAALVVWINVSHWQ